MFTAEDNFRDGFGALGVHSRNANGLVRAQVTSSGDG
jgi:hypothetical protein